jgi:HEAT repeat protein
VKNHEEYLKEFLSHSDRRYRISSAKSLIKKGGEGIEDFFLSLLDEEYRGIRSVAVWALGELGSSRAIDRIIELLNDRDSWVRRYAALSLAKIGEEKSLPYLVRAVENDPDRSVQLVAKWAIRKLKKVGEEDGIL